MINPQWLELPMSRTMFYGLKDVRAIEVRLYFTLCFAGCLVDFNALVLLSSTIVQLTLVISTSLISNNRLSRSEIWSLPKLETLTKGKKKCCGKEEKLLLRSNFAAFPQYFQYISNQESNYTYICQLWLFELFFPQLCKSDMSRYGYLEVFRRVPWNSR